MRSLHLHNFLYLVVENFGVAETPAITPRFRIVPMRNVMIIWQYADGQNHFDYRRCLLIQSRAKDTSNESKQINARSETVTEKPA